MIDTSKTWVMKAFEMLAEADDVPIYECRIKFLECLHKATVVGDELPIFQDSSDDEQEEEAADPGTQADDTNDPPEPNA